jgi:hypothetical protein
MMEVKSGLMSQILGKKKILLSKFHGFILIAVIPKKKNKKTQTRSSLQSLRFRNLVVHRFDMNIVESKNSRSTGATKKNLKQTPKN